VKNLALKIVCVLAALLIWIRVAATTIVETDVDLPLRVVGLADDLTVAGSALPEYSRVKLRTSKLRLIGHHYFGRSLGAVMIDLAGAKPGPTVMHELKESDVRSEAEVVNLLPPVRLPLRLDWQDTRRVPVRVSFRGRLPQDRLLLEPIQIKPDSLDITGPRQFVAGIDSLLTEPVDLPSLQKTMARELPLVPVPAPVRVGAGTVHVTIAVAAIGERLLANIPVIPLVESHLGEAAVSPPVCDVLVRGPADSVAVLSPARLTVTVPVANRRPGVHQLRGQVQHPAWVVSAQIEPASFTVLVGETAAGGVPR
jgi:hypothetical protein